MDLERLEKIDKLKTKMLKYIFYKKRTEKEVIEKFKNEDSELLEETLENLKNQGILMTLSMLIDLYMMLQY